MEENSFVWSYEWNIRLLELRYENDLLFRKKKQPWKEFHQILLENGFPDNMTIDQVRKKWTYLSDMYKAAKKSKNKCWPYYKLFEKIVNKNSVNSLDKYSFWPDEWRLKLITCISEAKSMKLDFHNMWRAVERAMRYQNLPENCCIQDIQGLWHHLRITFNRKYRQRKKKTKKRRLLSPEWALFDAMQEYFNKNEPDYIEKLESAVRMEYKRKSSNNYYDKDGKDGSDNSEDEFQWSKDITESFIQIRLQNDWLFRERKWAWNDLLAMMVNDFGFPKSLTGRELSKKWAHTYRDYQKAKATNNKNWVYYNLFDLYFGEGSLSLNPIVGWQEEWVSNLISARIDLNHLFNAKSKDQPWREVEKRLRSIGLPLDHSLLDLSDIWTHLLKTHRWKKKFAEKGILTEQWPYFEAMEQYYAIKDRTPPVIKHKIEKQETYDNDCDDAMDDDYEDDMKLFDLKQKLEVQVKPKLEYLEANNCRSCSNEDGCVNIYDHVDDDGVSLAEKLRIIGDVKVDPTDSLPSQICLNCVRELENAYKFRRKCQEVDQAYRSTSRVKVEITINGCDAALNTIENDSIKDDDASVGADNIDTDFNDFTNPEIKTIVPNTKEPKLEKKPVIRKTAPKVIRRKKKKIRKEKYVYYKICDICGKYTRNLKSHLDAHTSGKAYSCDVCDKKFKFKSGLFLHKATHDPTPKKKCEVCGKTFHIMAQYRRHFVYHANERKFGCETCGKRFNSAEILKVHARMHTDERPYSCPECGKTFRTSGCVSRHKRIVHRTKNQ